MVSNMLSSACLLQNSKQMKNSSSFTSFACSNILKVWTKSTHFRELLINHQPINNPHWYLVQNSNSPGSHAMPTPLLTRGGIVNGCPELWSRTSWLRCPRHWDSRRDEAEVKQKPFWFPTFTPLIWYARGKKKKGFWDVWLLVTVKISRLPNQFLEKR